MMRTESVARLTLISALSFLFQHFVCSQDFSEQRLQQACTTLQRTPLAKDEWQALAAASREATNSPALRCRAMAAYSLTFLLQGNTNAFERALQVIRSTCPEAISLVKVTRDDCYVMCQKCLGGGNQANLCPSCMGSGKCKACSGSGKKEAASCAACKGKGACGMCSGKKRIKAPCAACKGAGSTFSPKKGILDNFYLLLDELIAICRENAIFAEQFQRASEETDYAKRFELLKGLFLAFPNRADLGPAREMLLQAAKARAAEESRLRAKEKREREDRERTELLPLREVNAKDLNRAIAELLTYLKEHSDCANYQEIKVLADELIARRNRLARMRKILYIALSLLGVFLIASVLKPLVFRKKTGGVRQLPGMDKIDKTQFTDPLRLTAQESKARVKTKADESTSQK